MSWQSAERDKKDRAVVKARTENIKRLVISLRDTHYDKLDQKDDADLHEVQEVLDRIILRNQ